MACGGWMLLTRHEGATFFSDFINFINLVLGFLFGRLMEAHNLRSLLEFFKLLKRGSRHLRDSSLFFNL